MGWSGQQDLKLRQVVDPACGRSDRPPGGDRCQPRSKLYRSDDPNRDALFLTGREWLLSIAAGVAFALCLGAFYIGMLWAGGGG